MVANEEVTNNVIGISIKSLQITGQVLQDMAKLFLQRKTIHGKQPIRQLLSQNKALTKTELEKINLASFSKCMKHYGVDYSIFTNGESHTVFFKGEHSSQIEAALKEYAQQKLRPSIKETIQKAQADLKVKQAAKKNIKERSVPSTSL